MSIDARSFNTGRFGIPREDLLDGLREFAEEVGGAPSWAEMEAEGPYSPHTYARRFGSWNMAVAVAGFVPNKPGDWGSPSEAELLDALRGFADHLGHTPTFAEANNDGPFTAVTYANHFDSWNNALREAGLEINEEWEGEWRGKEADQ